MQKRDDYLKRLPREYYQADAFVHWTLTIQNRRTGWLIPIFYYKFRELLTHTCFRYGITCPIFCCMPDHIHMMWLGMFDGTDQLNAMKYFRRQLNEVLKAVGFELQLQGYDNVLSEEARDREAFEAICEYIARNPERKHIVETDRFMDYKFTSGLVPGAPELKFFSAGYWDAFWRVYYSSRENGLFKF